MIDWAQFHFLRPAWLALLAPLGLLLWQLARRRHASRAWEAVCDAALLPHILAGEGAPAAKQAIGPVALAGLIVTLALAGPAWSRLPQPVFSSTRALVIALDLSLSMNAADVVPNRVERARFKISDILRQRRDGQTALLVYAGDAFTVAPLTDDAATLLSQLPALTPAIMPARGNNVAAALGQARELLRQAGLGRGDVLLVTDEIDGEEGADLARALRGDGYRVSVLGVGTGEGAPIPLADGSFLKDDHGEIVIPALREEPLQQLAGAGGGIYRRIAVDDADVGAIAAFLDVRPSDDESRATELQADVWRDQGPWLVLALLPLAALGFRRGLVLALVLTVLPLPQPAQALEWPDLWLRADQQGKRALDAGDPARAAALFADPRWRGAARYQSGDFPGALEAMEKSDDADSLYNRGNALARTGRYPEAVAAYDQALTLQPDHADAKFNRELVQQQLQPPPESQQPTDQPETEQPGSGDQARGDTPPDASQDQPQQEQSADSRSPAGRRADDSQSGGEQSPNQPPPGAGAAEGSASTDTDMPPPDSGTQAAQTDADDRDSERRNVRDGTEDVRPQAGENDNTVSPPASAGASQAAPTESVPEDQQALEQWLRRIPDDPGGLLRRKFQYQYQMRRAQSGVTPPGEKTW